MLFYATARAHGAPCYSTGKQGAGALSFRQRLGRDPDIASKLSAEELDRAFDLQHHLRWTGEIIDRALRDGGN